MVQRLFGLVAACAITLCATQVRAEPVLQIYIEGSTYDTATQTWTLDTALSSSTPLRLWTIGNVQQFGTISDVKLAIAFDNTLGLSHSSFNIVSSTTGGFGGFTDPSTPQAVANGSSGDGNVPLLSDGSSLPSHGEYGAGIEWVEFKLGNFTLQDSPIADFINTLPSPGSKNGQINVYDISLNAAVAGGTKFHFDLYDSVQAKNKARAVFAPFSHDGTTTNVVPEPTSLVAFGSLLLGLAGFRAARRRKATSMT